MRNPKRHHFVPKMYLDRFTRDDVVVVRRRDAGGRTYGSGTVNVAVESGFYDLPTAAGGVSKEVEDWLGGIEGDAADAFRSIDAAMEAPPLGADEREVLAFYLGLQLSRTPEQRERLSVPTACAAFLDGRTLTLELMAEFLKVQHLGFAPSERETQAAFDLVGSLLPDIDQFTQDKVLTLMVTTAQQAAPILGSMCWTIEHDRKARFITSDTPLVLWRTPSPRDRFEGFGLQNCEEIRFPLDPTKQLVLTHKVGRPPSARVSPKRAADCNQDLALACHHIIIGSPSEKVRMIALDLPPKRPVQRFDSGPELRQDDQGRWVETGQEILHMWVPRR